MIAVITHDLIDHGFPARSATEVFDHLPDDLKVDEVARDDPFGSGNLNLAIIIEDFATGAAPHTCFQNHCVVL